MKILLGILRFIAQITGIVAPELGDRAKRKLEQYKMEFEEKEQNRYIENQIGKVEGAEEYLDAWKKLVKESQKLNVDLDELADDLELVKVQTKVEEDETNLLDSLPEEVKNKVRDRIQKNRETRRTKWADRRERRKGKKGKDNSQLNGVKHGETEE